jgi:signal transduction histidine kinase/CheY-like chemotaxis protein
MIYGTLFMIAMYNLFIYVSIKEKSHLMFVLFSSFTALFISFQEGHFAEFIATDTLWPKDIFYGLMTGLMCFFFAWFSIHFLDLERWSKWQMRLMMAIGSLAALALVFMGLMPESFIFSPYTLLIIICVYGIGIGTGLYVWHRGVALAGFYTLAIFLCNIGLMLEIISHQAFFPWTKFTYSYASIGNTMMILVFAFAIADKMRLLQKDKLAASMKLVKLTEEKAQNSVDMYKSKLHEIELTKEANEAKIESRAKSEFLATMSHEIRTPMNGVLGMTELLNDTDLDSKQKHYATSIRNSAKALLNAINDLLDYTKIESGRMEIDYRLFNLEKIFDDCISIFALRASQSKICFTGIVQPSTPIQLKGDPEKVRQILLNLLGNAFNFTNKNDISLTAYPTGKATINSVEIRFDITTEGMILSPEEKESLFSRTHSNNNDRKHSGHELGLTVSRQLAELMQGTIGVDTTETNTTLWFTARFILPHSNEEKTLTDRTKILSGRKILVCDNHPAFLKSVQTLTESWGMNTTTTNNTKDLIEALLHDSNAYQILLIGKDLLTPEIQLTVRQSNVNHNYITSIIMATQSCSTNDADELKKQGIVGILETPYTSNELYQSLIKAMGIENEKTAESTITKKELSVLIAEDNNVNLMVLEGLLKKLRIYPVSAHDGKQAIDSYQTHKKPFDVIFMDCEMPEADGYEATSTIRQYETQERITPAIIIGLSAHSNTEYKDRAIAAGMNDFLIKPVNTEDIENVLERIHTGFYLLPKQMH